MRTVNTNIGVFQSFNNDIDFTTKNIPNQSFIETHLSKYLHGTTSIILVGSGIGTTELLLTKINPTVNIYSFEPREKMFCLLVKNLAINKVENVIIMNNALGHMTGTIDIPYKKDVECDHQDILELCNGTFVASSSMCCFVTLDSLKLLKCDFLFLNFHGFDYLTILGGLVTIKKFKPVICFYYDKDLTDKVLGFLGVKNDIFDLLEKLQYKVSKIENFVIATPFNSL